VTCSRTQPFS